MIGSLYMAVNPPPQGQGQTQPPPPPPPLGSRLAQLSPDIGAGVINSILSRGSSPGSREQVQHERDLLQVAQQRLRAEQQILDIQGRLTTARRDQYNAALQDARLLDNNLRIQERVATLHRMDPSQSMHRNLAAYESQYGRAPGLARAAVGVSSAFETILQHPGQAVSTVVRGGGMLAGRVAGRAVGGAAEALGGMVGAGAQGAALGSLIGSAGGAVLMAGLAATLTQLPAAIRHMTETENIFRRQGPTPNNPTAESLYELRNRGIGFGYTVDTTMGVAQQMAAGGMMQGNRLTSDRLASVMQFSRLYGVNPEETGGFVAQMNRMGVGEGEAGTRGLANQLAFAIRQGNMGGRENEVIQSLQTLAQSMAARGVAPDVGRIGAVQTILNAGQNPMLRGEYGANALQNLGAGIQGASGYQQAFLYSVARRVDPNLSPVSMLYEQEKGVQSKYMPAYLQAFYELGGKNLDTAGVFMHMMMPQVSATQSRALLEANQAANQRGERLTSEDITKVMGRAGTEGGITGAEVPLQPGETIEKTVEQARATFEGFAVGLAQSGSKLIDMFNQLGDAIKNAQQSLSDPNAVISSIIGGNNPGPQIPGVPNVVIPNPGTDIGKAIRKGIGMPEGIIPHIAAQLPGAGAAIAGAVGGAASAIGGAVAPVIEGAPGAAAAAGEAIEGAAGAVGEAVGGAASAVGGAAQGAASAVQGAAARGLAAIQGVRQFNAAEYAGFTGFGAIIPGVPGPMGDSRGDYVHGVDAYTCGPAAIVAVLRAQGQNVTIGQVAHYAASLGALTGEGITMHYVPDILSHFGGSAVNVQNPQQIQAELAAGHPVLTSINSGVGADNAVHSFPGGHIVTITGALPNGNYSVADSSGHNITEIGPGRLRNIEDSYAITSYGSAAAASETPGSSSPLLGGPPNLTPTPGEQGDQQPPIGSASPLRRTYTSNTYAGQSELGRQIINDAVAMYGDAAGPVVDALLSQEKGLTGTVGDTDINATGSHGPFQFYGGGGQLNVFATQHNMTPEQAGQYVREHPMEAARWALNTYLRPSLSRAGQQSQEVTLQSALGAQNPGASRPGTTAYENYASKLRAAQQSGHFDYEPDPNVQSVQLPRGFDVNAPMVGQDLQASQQMMAISFNNPTVTIQLPDGTVVGQATLTPFEDSLNAVDRSTRAGFGGVTI